jgi:hypothetical protein
VYGERQRETERERGEVPDHLGLAEKSTMATVYDDVAVVASRVGVARWW